MRLGPARLAVTACAALAVAGLACATADELHCEAVSPDGNGYGDCMSQMRTDRKADKEYELDAPACERGDGQACYRAGSYGGTRTAHSQAKQLEAACRAGIADACFRLGQEDVGPRGRAYYERACELGSGRACGEVAVLQPEGPGRDALGARACSLGQTRWCPWPVAPARP